MKPLLITGISVLFTLTSAAQAVTPVPQSFQLPPFHPQYQAQQHAARLDNSAIEEQFATPAQVRFEKVEMPGPALLREDKHEIVRFSNPAGQEEFQCREHNGVIDQCFAKTAPRKASKAAAVLPDQPNTDERLTIENLVLPDSRFKACVTTSAQQNNWAYADQVQWLNCSSDSQHVPIQDLTGIAQLVSLQSLYVGAESAAKNSLTGLTELESLTQLDNISIERYQINSLDFVSRIPNLKGAGLHRLKVDGGWQVLASLDQLRNLQHSTDEASDKPDIISLINQMSGLKSIIVNAPLHKNLVGLVHPDLSSIYTFDADHLNFLAGTPAVHTLTIYQGSGGDIDLSALSSHRKLLSLTLSNVIFEPTDIQQLQQQTDLTYLRLEGATTLTSLSFINQMPLLAYLILRNTITDANLATLSIPDNLQFLGLDKFTQAQYGYATLTNIQKIIQNPKKITTLDLNGQIALPCAEIDLVKTKINAVYAPSQCGVKDTKLADINIPDSALYQCISQHMVQQNASFLEGITYLNCSNVKDLSGIHHLTNLQSFSVSSTNNQDVVGDLSPISQLSKLRTLNLNGQKLTAAKIGITYPASLSALLFDSNLLDQTAVPTLQALLPRLNQLRLNSNLFTDFSWITNAPNLRTLGVGQNPVTNLSFITALPQLTNLSISGLNLTDLTGFTLPTGLTQIDVRQNKLTNLNQLTSRLSNPALLTYLTAGSMNLVDISSLSLMPNLQFLDLYGSKGTTDYSAIGNLTKLTWLNLQEAELPKKFPDFTVPPALKQLYMTQYAGTNISVTDISALIAAAGQFQSVMLQGQVAIACDQIDALRNHANKAAFQLPTQCGQLLINADTIPDPVLRQCVLNSGNRSFSEISWLQCTGNIKDWTGLQWMTQLSGLFVRGSATTPQDITNLALFKQLPALVNLELRNQGITDQALDILGNTKTTYLSLDGNPITQASFSKLMTNFSSLENISLAETAISSLNNVSELNVSWLGLGKNTQLTNYTALNSLGAKTIGLHLEPVNNAALQGLSLPATIKNLYLTGDVWTSTNQIFSKLTQPANLEALYIANNTFSDLTGIGVASKLINFSIASDQASGLADFSPLATLPVLNWLDLRTPSLTSLTPISNLLPKLDGIGLDKSKVTDFSLLKNMAKAKNISLSDTLIKDLSGLHNLTNLDYVNLSNNNHLACSELELLDSKKPANAYIQKPEFCTKYGGLLIQKMTGQGPTAVAFTNSADSVLGQLRVETGSIIFTPAANVSGWVTLRLTLTYSGNSSPVDIKIWVEPTDPAKAEYYGSYYLWSEDGIYAGATTPGRIELRADGGTFYSNYGKAEFGWTLSGNGLLTLNFDNFVESVGFQFISGVGQVEVRRILTQITLQRGFTETDATKQMNFSMSRTGYTRYMTGGKPDEPYPANNSNVNSTRNAGLLDPVSFLQSDITVAIPGVDEERQVVYPSALNLSQLSYLVRAQKLKFQKVSGLSGTGSLNSIQVEPNGEFSDVATQLTWQINQDKTVTMTTANGGSYSFAFLGLSSAQLPVVQMQYVAPNQGNSTTVIPFSTHWSVKVPAIDANYMKQFRTLELVQSGTESSRFWFELNPIGTGLTVSWSDSNADKKFSDNEVAQTPIRWELQNGVIEIRRYRYNSLSGKSGVCLSKVFAPAATSECITDTRRSYDIFNIFAHNGIPTASIFNVQRTFYTDRNSSWPAQDLLNQVIAVDHRYLQIKSERPLPIKPLVVGVAIADDVLRQCLQNQPNLHVPSDLIRLTCQGDVRSLQGLEKFTSLQSLTIGGQNRLTLSGLEVIHQLPKLTSLELTSVQIGDTEFAKLANLAPELPFLLSLHAVGLTDAAHAVLDTMKVGALILGGPVELMSFTRLPNDKTLANLEYLELNNLRLANLQTELNRLQTLTNMTDLGLVNLNLGTLNNIKLPVNLAYLYFSEENISSLDPAKLNPTKLAGLFINKSDIRNIGFISGLTKLAYLSLQSVTLTDWSPLMQKLPALTQLSAQFNAHVPCSVFAAIKTANPQASVNYIVCASTAANQYELANIPAGTTISTAVFSQNSDSSKGTLSVVNGKIQYTPAKNITGWVEFNVFVTLSDGSTRSFRLRTFIKPPSTRKSGLPWWVTTKPVK